MCATNDHSVARFCAVPGIKASSFFDVQAFPVRKLHKGDAQSEGKKASSAAKVSLRAVVPILH